LKLVEIGYVNVVVDDSPIHGFMHGKKYRNQ
jgi:hypothetical protein